MYVVVVAQGIAFLVRSEIDIYCAVFEEKKRSMDTLIKSLNCCVGCINFILSSVFWFEKTPILGGVIFKINKTCDGV